MSFPNLRTAGLAGVLLTATLAGVQAGAQSQHSFDPSPRVFRGRVRGSEAAAALGGRLSEVAARHGKSLASLRSLLAKDGDVWMDDRARLVYVCGDTPRVAEDAPDVAAAAPFPLENTFQLHSRPGSNRTLYLDFDGHTTTGTYWNSSFTSNQAIVSAPFDLDGNPGSFSATEQEAIQQVWQRVAEDYAPFDVNVTTQDPGVEDLRRSSSGDLRFGTRAIISPTSSWYPGAGGVAYIGVFDAVITGNDLPCFVFSGNLSNNERNIAEATSHEAGHTLGLNHDGKGSASYHGGESGSDWAPIMGVGYYKSVTQWSRGEYANATNTEDDLAIIPANGAALLTDDHGNTAAAATTLGASVQGVITTRTDVDFFRFATGGGSATLSASPAARGGNLDIKLSLYDSAGALVAEANPTGLAASLSRTLAAGTYYVAVDGVGFGDPTAGGYSDYASIGQYTLTSSVTGTPPPTASITVGAPNGGESWTTGSARTLLWSSVNVSGNVKLEYSANGGSSWSVINANTANDGSEAWTAPATPTTEGRVRVSALDGSATDVSNGNFTVAAPAVTPTLTVLSPNGGENWTAGSSQVITWSSTNLTGNVKLEYSANNGSSWSVINAGTANDGSEPWTAPASATSQGRIRVSSVPSPSVLDVSNSAFAITVPVVASITVTAPNGGQSWAAGSSQTLTWSSTGVSGNVKLEYSTNGGGAWTVINAGTANDGSETWTVPNTPTTQALVRVTAVTGGQNDVSNSVFTITAPVPAGDSYEADDSAATAKAISAGQTQTRSIHVADNADWIKLVVGKKRRATITTAGAAGGDTVLELYQADGQTLITGNDNYTSGGYSRIANRTLVAGTYFIKVAAKGSTTISSYTVNVTLRK